MPTPTIDLTEVANGVTEILEMNTRRQRCDFMK